jgi:hypothetical protein
MRRMSGRARGARGALTVSLAALAILWWWAGDPGDAPTDGDRASPRGAAPAAVRSELPDAAGGFTAPAPESLPAPAAAAAEALTVSPGPPASWARLIGRVLRPDGTPAAGVNVVHPLQPGANLAGQLRASPPRTAGDGSFEVALAPLAAAPAASLLLLDGPPAARVLVHVPAPHAGDNDLGDLLLADGAGVSGRLVGPDGLPLARAYVCVRAPDDEPGLFDSSPDDVVWQNLAAEFTADDGRFLLTGLPAADMELFAQASGFEQLTLRGLAPRSAELTELGDLRLSEGRVLQGVLLDAGGAPVAGRQVMAWAERSFPRGSSEARIDTGHASGFALTDEHGGFRIGGLHPGVYELAAWAEGHAFTRLHEVADDERDVVLRLRRAGRVLLTLRDALTGAPLGGAQVEASMAPRTGYSSGNAYAVTAGPDAGMAEGVYVVDGCGEDPTVLAVSREGYAPLRVTTEGLGAGEQRELLLDLAPCVVLAGIVQDQFEQPVAHATVQIGAPPESGVPTRMSRPAEDGLFRFDDVAVGSWQVWADAPGHGRADTHGFEIPAGGLSGVIVRLPVLGRAEGLVAAPDGTGLSGARVMAALVHAAPLRGRPPRGGLVIASENQPRTFSEIMSDADGRFVLESLWPGTWLLAATLGADAGAQVRLDALATAEATAQGTPGQTIAPLSPDVRRVTIVDGETTRADLSVPVPAQIGGRVVSDGRPLAGARVVLGALNGDRATALASDETDAAGDFRFERVEPGPFVVLAFGEDEVVPRGRRVTLHDAEQVFVEVSFHGPTLRGVVVDEADGRPVGDVEVTVYAGALYAGDGLTLAELSPQALQALGSLGTRPATFRTDASGRFEVRHLPPGRWLCSARGDRWLSAGQASVDLPDDWTPEPIEVEVRAGALVQGSIRYAFGGGWPPDVEVQLYSPERNGMVKFDHTTEGHYLIGGVEPGAYELRLRDMQPGSAPYVVARPILLTAGQSLTVDLIYEDS